jgi:uncharacterized membrane protein YidH (DUF202 family)
MDKHRNWYKRLAAFDGIGRRNKMAAAERGNVFWSAGKVWFLVAVALCVFIWVIF